MNRKSPLTVEQVLAWADAHHARTGEWPTALSGHLAGVPGENWRRINHALHHGSRGLPGKDSLARCLERHRGRERWQQPNRWTAEEDVLVRTLPAPEAAQRTGRSLRAVGWRRQLLGIARRRG